MKGVKEQSGILTWGRENVSSAPKSEGVAVLRFSPVNGDILRIEHTDNLQEYLTKYLDPGKELAEVKFFEWYTTDSKMDAVELAKFLSERHSLHHPHPTEQ